jgi:hypothetical protein
MATGGDVDDLIAQFKKWNSVSKPKDPNKMTNQAWGKCVQDCIGKDTTTKQSNRKLLLESVVHFSTSKILNQRPT